MRKLFQTILFVSLLFVSFTYVSETRADDDFWDDKINVSLSYSPENPINNPENPTEITVSAFATGKNPTDEMDYTMDSLWQHQKIILRIGKKYQKRPRRR